MSLAIFEFLRDSIFNVEATVANKFVISVKLTNEPFIILSSILFKSVYVKDF